MTLEPGVKTKLGRMLGYGVWAGALLGVGVMEWNVSRFGAAFPDLGAWTMAHAMVYVSISAAAGYVLWGGYVLKG